MGRTITDRPNSHPWINPVGGMGDMLMVSGVLRKVERNDPKQRFNLIRRTNYVRMFRGHPAIALVGFPQDGAEIRSTTYWSMETLAPHTGRPYQILARAFGLQTPIDEVLYLPGLEKTEQTLLDCTPSKNTTIVIAPASDSQRKMLAPETWHAVVARLKLDGAFVIQVGRREDVHIRNAYSLLGLTTPHQLVLLLERSDLVITSDSLILHAAHMVDAPTVAVWGPTNHEIYGYPKQTHIQLPKSCDLSQYDDCIGPAHNNGGKDYNSPCPEGTRHCMTQINPDRIYAAATEKLHGD